MAIEGWHIPSDEEWKELELYLGMEQSKIDDEGWRGTNEGSKLKAESGWNSGGNGTNESGFTALPGGSRYFSTGDFMNIGFNASFWTFTESDTHRAWYRTMTFNYSHICRSVAHKEFGLSVRLVKD